MHKFDWYVGRAVLMSTLAVLLLLVGLDALTSVVDETDDMGEGYGFSNILVYVGYTLPRRVHEFVPFAALIGALIGLGRLATTSELVVMRAAGVSLTGIALMALKPALLVAAMGFSVGEFIAPHSEQLAMSYRALAQRSESSVAGLRAWNRDGNTFVHVDAVQRGGVAYGLTLLSFTQDRRLSTMLVAERATHAGDHWMLEQVQLTHSTLSKPCRGNTLRRWDTAITPQLLTLDVVAPRRCPFCNCGLCPVPQAAGYGLRRYRIGVLAQSITAIGYPRLVLVAMSFIFGPLREGTMGARVFIGVIVGVVFRISQDFFGPASLIFGYDPLVAAVVPISVCWIGGLWLLWRRA